MLTLRSQKAERPMSKLTWSWSGESEPQRSRNLLARDVRLRCRRNQTGTVGLGEANCGGTQLRTWAHLGNRNHHKRTPQSFYDLPTNACLYVDRERLPQVLGRRLGRYFRPSAQAARSVWSLT